MRSKSMPGFLRLAVTENCTRCAYGMETWNRPAVVKIFTAGFTAAWPTIAVRPVTGTFFPRESKARRSSAAIRKCPRPSPSGVPGRAAPDRSPLYPHR
ncbi:hypothetical protein RJ40_11825 [Methanofollis aquaemaris]|uniref:Uncharacterized protein n=1 Tax=Methanofollis aquaemaris TaxID=126734 RepID=A0A8A3S920_9EURY|nr:hypothetical protein [Methanofollis aquaemaris]QSZ68134.1 hypothetical protein RJ40_11825 [Methanofollis aquaemaris]